MENILFWLLPVLFLSGCSPDRTVPAVDSFNLKQYMGVWYEIARLPNRFEQGMTHVTAEYTLLPSGQVKIVNRGIKNNQKKSVTGIARVPRKARGAELEVSFFRPFFSSYRIVKLGPDYRYSIVLGSNRRLLWILSRTPTLSPEDRTEIKKFLKQHNLPPLFFQ
ncbi:MAG: lipocalin family protein [Lentisphaeria bacterium]|nr:lipocalin family protein [Lentisphaeria bacterium]